MVDVLIDWQEANIDIKDELVGFWVKNVLIDYPVFNRYYTINDDVKNWFIKNDIQMVCAFMIGYFHPKEDRYYPTEAYYYGGWRLIKGVMFVFDTIEEAILFKLKWG